MLQSFTLFVTAVAITIGLIATARPASSNLHKSPTDWNELLGGKGIFENDLNIIQDKSYEDAALLEEFKYFINQRQNLETVYSKYRLIYSKTKDDSEVRRDHFKNELVTIATHNLEANAGKQSWWMGVNQFTDITESELDILSGSFAGKTNDRAAVHTKTKVSLYGNPAPESLDYVLWGFVTDVKNQGSCASCAMFSAIALVESSVLKGTDSDKYSLSEQELIDCAVPGFSCWGEGSEIEDSLDYLEAHGVSDSVSYPNSSPPRVGPCRKNDTVRSGGISGYKSYFNVTETDLKNILFEEGPLSIYIRQTSPYQKGIMTKDVCGDKEVNHAVLLVGYGDEDGQDYWLIKNSYGLEWGEDGFIRIERGTGACRIGSHVFSATAISM